MTNTNIVLVVFDTLRRDVVGCYGDRPPWGADFPRVQTPNLDRFAESAIRFDRAFPEVLPTIPARRALYTGQRVYPFHNGDFRLKGDFVTAPGWGPIPEEQDTLAEIFRTAGYRTGLVTDVYHQFKPSKNFGRGFDQWSFVRGQEADPARSGPKPSFEEVERYIPEELIRIRSRADTSAGIRRSTPRWAQELVRNFYDRTVESDWTSAQVFINAVDWLEQNRDARDHGEGVFLTVECFDPHEPWFVPDHYRKKYDASDGQDNVLSPYAELEMDPAILRRTRANYAGLVTMVDHWFGALLAKLERDGWLDDTIVVAAGDHGHAMLERGYMGKRGYPSTPEVVHLPLLIRLPGGEHGNTASDGWIQYHDIPATLLDLVGIEPPQPIDGRSARATITEGAPPVREHIVCAWGSGLVVVTDDWWLSIKANGRGALLYPRDQADDPAAVSVAEQHPDVVEKLFNLALDEARGGFPDFILEAAERAEDAPGCSPVAAVALTDPPPEES